MESIEVGIACGAAPRVREYQNQRCAPYPLDTRGQQTLLQQTLNIPVKLYEVHSDLAHFFMNNMRLTCC